MAGKNKRRDPAWKYGKEFLGHEEEGEQGKKKPYIYIDCNFCRKIIKGGVLRMKHHLAGSHENSQPCESAPPEVVEEMKNYLAKGKKVKEIRQENFDFLSSRGSYYGGSEQEVVSNVQVQIQSNSERGVRGPMDCFVIGSGASGASGEGGSNEPRVMAQSAKERRDNVCLDIGRFFFENGLPFYIATSPSFANMIRSIGEYGRGLRPPSMYELRTWILTEEVNTTKKMVDDVKKTWPSTGVNIMSDGWTDMRGRTLINFLVNNPEGTVFLKCVDASDAVKDGDLLFKLLDEIVEEVGEEHVVQVCTDNAPNYKKAGKLLMEKRPHLYWTPCSAHCLDLILEALYELPQLVNAVLKAKKVAKFIYNHGYVLALMRKYTKTELVRPAVTRFATANLTLESLLKSKQALEEMFASRRWTNSKWGRTKEGKSIRKIILNDPNFWQSVSYSLKVTRPLVKVLRIVDSEKEPAMGFLYGAMDQAKEEIKNNLDNDISSYKEIWDIIDEKWDMRKEQRDLHAAACYLNPQIHYEPGATFNSNIMTGLYNCLDRLIVDVHERDQIHLELDKFKGKHGMFGRTQAETTRKKRSPANWWLAYGIEQPSLMNFAVRVLSLTCSASTCERNWSTFNQVHTKRRNRLDQKSMVALVYVMYNKKLKIKKLLRKTKMDKADVDPLVCDDIESDNEWVAPQDQEIGEGSGSGTPNEDPLEENNIEEDPNIIDENLDELDVERLENQIGIDNEENLDEAIEVTTNTSQRVDDVRGKRPMQTQPVNVFSRRSTVARGSSNARGGSNARGVSSNARAGSNARGVNVRGGSNARGPAVARGRGGSNASSRGGASARGHSKRGRKRKLTLGDKHMREIDAEDDDPEWMDIEGEDEEDGSPPIRYQDDSMDDESSGEDEDLEDEEDI